MLIKKILAEISRRKKINVEHVKAYNKEGETSKFNA